MKSLTRAFVGLLLLAGTPILPIPGVALTPAPNTTPSKPTTPNTTVTAVTYVYEKDESAIPVGVTSGINKLNREKKVVATLFEKDTVDGNGEVPAQYKPALDAARRSSIPALVVLSGSSVVKIIKAPKTEAEVLGAVP